MTDRGLRSWTHGLSPREQVRAIATTLTEPRSGEWIREQARVSSWQTTKDELEMLAESGHLHELDGDDEVTKYAPNDKRRYITEVTELINTHTREELREEIGVIQSDIDQWMHDFDVASREALVSTLTDETLGRDAIRKQKQVLRRWERQADNKRLLHHALELYDDARTLYQERNDETNSSNSLSG